ncbi:YcaO-like family protein [Nonomuraea angiospora]
MTDPDSLNVLLSPYGVVSRVETAHELDSPERLSFAVAGIGSGMPGRATSSYGRIQKGGLAAVNHVFSGGRAWDSPAMARFVAIAEGAERYAGFDILGEERIWATADELGGDCLDPARYPRCSPAEYGAADCPMRPFDPAARIRWSRGLDLVTGREVWVPSVMACPGLRDAVPAEGFTFRMSTGMAVHTDPVEAVVQGVCEVVERDAAALAWLQRLPLPRIAAGDRSEAAQVAIDWCAARSVETHLFDASTELGVPVAYCVLADRRDRRACHAVGAGTGRTLRAAADKALFEAIGMRAELRRAKGLVPDSPADFRAMEDGARYMGAAGRAPAFAFLLDQAATDAGRPAQPAALPGALPAALPGAPDLALRRLVSGLAAAGMRAVVVDRTPDELAGAGLTAVNVVVPDLQPLSLHPRAQFKGHPRLYEAPARMGHRVLAEEELNPWPQPFA